MEDRVQSQPATKGDLTTLKVELKSEISTLDTKVLKLSDTVTGLAIELSKTQADVREIKETLATKMSTKDDLSAVDIKLGITLARTQADVREIKETIATEMSTKGDISRVMSAIDAFAAEALSYRNHDTIRGGKIIEHEGKLENHESRLVLLETPK